MKRAVKFVDVFSSVPFKGNPVAVVLDAEGLTAEQMQQIARWTNLSETTFVLNPSDGNADYRVRIFTPRNEMVFAGHPTLGTAHALLEAGIVKVSDGKLVQECGVGLVNVSVTDDPTIGRSIAFDLPTAKFESFSSTQRFELEKVLACSNFSAWAPLFVNVGPALAVAQLQSADDVLSLSPDFSELTRFSERYGVVGLLVFGAYPSGGDAAIESRAFFPLLGVDEDPVCGSGNGGIAAFVHRTGQTALIGSRYISSQGAKVGRSGKVRISIDQAGDVTVGGQCVTCFDGKIRAC